MPGAQVNARAEAVPTALEAVAWPDIPDPAVAVVVPLGSAEQHGHHLPFDTDTVVAATLARALVTQRPELVLAPALGYGASGEHEGFPGTLSIGCAALELVLVELGRSASRWARRLLLVNGHGGNLAPLHAAVSTLRQEGREVAYWSPAVPGGDAHAGRTETSLLLALRPSAVRLAEAVPGPVAPLAGLLPAIRAGSTRSVSPSGVLGDPAGASANEGSRLLAGLVADLVGAVDGWLAGGPGGRLAGVRPRQRDVCVTGVRTLPGVPP